MTKNQATINDADPKTRKVPIQERSVLVGDLIVVNGHAVNRALLKRRFAEGGYQAQETPHFLLFTRETAPKTILCSLVRTRRIQYEYFTPSCTRTKTMWHYHKQSTFG